MSASVELCDMERLTWVGRLTFVLLYATHFGIAAISVIVGMFTAAEPAWVQLSSFFGGASLALAALVGFGAALAGDMYRPLLITSTCLLVAVAAALVEVGL